MRLSDVIAALLLFAVQPSFARDIPADPSSNTFYRSSDGSKIHGPTKTADAAYGGVSADCRDGTQSYSHHHSGTCSGHGGGWPGGDPRHRTAHGAGPARPPRCRRLRPSTTLAYFYGLQRVWDSLG
jgi:Protein of unknown function (DUF3761)